MPDARSALPACWRSTTLFTPADVLEARPGRTLELLATVYGPYRPGVPYRCAVCGSEEVRAMPAEREDLPAGRVAHWWCPAGCTAALADITATVLLPEDVGPARAAADRYAAQAAAAAAVKRERMREEAKRLARLCEPVVDLTVAPDWAPPGAGPARLHVMVLRHRRGGRPDERGWYLEIDGVGAEAEVLRPPLRGLAPSNARDWAVKVLAGRGWEPSAPLALPGPAGGREEQVLVIPVRRTGPGRMLDARRASAAGRRRQPRDLRPAGTGA
ncbi:hypothetical protein OG618_37475 (plasmid) [Kitasatospora sp. NBC_01246]|uniref:hypothetical protein n=1 Tax=Kitasatospora sp. NBC_01246 TaxID=2903570 RepID=UPI002E30C30A|nr:hypothetical protein [Kitasatospora sp. NBC_01246]